VNNNLEIVMRFLDALGERDSEHTVADAAGAEAHALIHPDCIFINPMVNPDRGLVDRSKVPSDGVFRGPEGLDADLALVASLWDIQVKRPELYDLGDVVLFRGVAAATGKVTGKSNESDFLELFWVEDGLITKVHAANDTKALWICCPIEQRLPARYCR
jgi:ketosteroid isomerase-like protein